MKNSIHILIFIVGLLIVLQSYDGVASVEAHVESRGEINVAGETKGIVPASSTVPLIVTLLIDRSLAEQGEEIKTIEITMPKGFVTELKDFKGIWRDGEELIARVVISGGNVLRIELAKPIEDFENSIYEISYFSQTPNTIFEAVFSVLLRNKEDGPVGEFIKPGQADGEPNNNDFTLQVIPNVPPAPVTGFSVEVDKTGENDVTLRWQKSKEADVNGYLIYRDKEIPIKVENRASTTFRDVNVLPGNHTYQITAYKTIFLQSDRSSIQSVDVPEDTAAPQPPTHLRIVPSKDGVEVSWKPSVSRDVAVYRILFGTSVSGTLEPLPNGEISVEKPANETMEYKFIDSQSLDIGSFTYAIIAIDEVGNESSPIKIIHREFDKPYPNPFTPLSPDPAFNTVVFPKRTIQDSEIEDGEEEFSVHLFNLKGVLVKTLTAQLGETELKWDGKNESGEIVESGIYVYQLQFGDSYKTGTIIVAK